MRIVVVNTAASSGGALSILKDFYNYVRENEKSHEWIFILSDNYIQETENIKVIINKDVKKNWINRLIWESKKGSDFINKLSPDLVFSMQNTIGKGIKCKSMIYLHQSLPFQNTKKFSFIRKTERKMAIYQYFIGYIIKKSLYRTDKIVVQTEWMKRSVLQKINKKPSDIIVSPPTIQDIQYKVNDNYGKEKIFFYPAGKGVYKNHKIIIEASKILLKKGINNFIVELTLDESQTSQLNITSEIENNIKLLGNLKREEVFNKYTKSVLLFPSYIETYGLPLLEARLVGCMILCSDTEFSREILDDYKNREYFNPFSAKELSELMERIILKDDIPLNIEKQYNNNEGWKKILNEINKTLNV